MRCPQVVRARESVRRAAHHPGAGSHDSQKPCRPSQRPRRPAGNLPPV